VAGAITAATAAASPTTNRRIGRRSGERFMAGLLGGRRGGAPSESADTCGVTIGKVSESKTILGVSLVNFRQESS
jgi:hypothetical protein